MENSLGAMATLVGSFTAAALVVAVLVVKWFDRRIGKIEENVAGKQNGALKAFIAKQDKRHKAVCRRQNKLEKIVYAFIAEIKEEQGARATGKLKTRAEDAPP